MKHTKLIYGHPNPVYIYTQYIVYIKLSRCKGQYWIKKYKNFMHLVHTPIEYCEHEFPAHFILPFQLIKCTNLNQT